MIAIACVVLAAVLGVGAFIFQQEYPDVGVRLARRVLAVAVRGAPMLKRERWAEEWAAELHELSARRDTCTGLGFALCLAAACWGRRLVVVMDPTPAACIAVLAMVQQKPALEVMISAGAALVSCSCMLAYLTSRTLHAEAAGLEPRAVSLTVKILACGLLGATATAIIVGIATGRGTLALSGALNMLILFEAAATKTWRLAQLRGAPRAL